MISLDYEVQSLLVFKIKWHQKFAYSTNSLG